MIQLELFALFADALAESDAIERTDRMRRDDGGGNHRWTAFTGPRTQM